MAKLTKENEYVPETRQLFEIQLNFISYILVHVQ